MQFCAYTNSYGSILLRLGLLVDQRLSYQRNPGYFSDNTGSLKHPFRISYSGKRYDNLIDLSYQEENSEKKKKYRIKTNYSDPLVTRT